MTGQSKKRVLLLDSHAILHRAYHALPDLRSDTGEPTGALYGYVTFLLKAIKDLKPDYVVAAFDLPGPTFRDDAYTEYKAGRAKTDDDLIAQLGKARTLAEALGVPCYEYPGFEADDMLGTMVKELRSRTDVDVIIASGDMDTMQLVDADTVRVYTLKKGLNDTIIYNEEAVRARFGFSPKLLPDYKGLRGDPSDNIIGVPGIGEKTGSELISKFGTLETIFELIQKDPELLRKEGIKERIIELLRNNQEEAMFSKMLATIRDDAPINFTLPEKTWRQGIDPEKASQKLKEFSFRSLIPRFLEAVQEKPASSVSESVLPAQKTPKKENGKNEARGEKVSDSQSLPENFKKLQIMAWLVDSDKTDPSIEDICAVAGVDHITEAEKPLLEKIRENGLEQVFENIELPLMPIVDKAEKFGVLVDPEQLRKLSKEYHGYTATLEKEIWNLAGKEFNVASPKQLGEVLFDDLKLEVKGLKKTAGGARSTRESELDKLKDLHPIIHKILEYREYQKLLSTYIDSIPKLLDANNRLHTRLRQAGTTTGRMSSIDPNLQNIPIKTEAGRKIREAFIASPGKELLAFDYSQIELRVAAALSGDPKLLDIFRQGGDVHASVASLVFGVPPEKVDHEMRRRAKVINFGIIYGMGVNALKQNLGTTRDEAQQFYDAYFDQFNVLSAYLDKLVADAKKNKFTTTYFGRRRYYKNINSRMPQLRAMEERMAGNAPLQGTAADIIKLAMIKADEQLARAGLEKDAALLLQVHDELIYEVTSEKSASAANTIKDAMETVAHLGVPLVVNASRGRSWGTLSKIVP